MFPTSNSKQEIPALASKKEKGSFFQTRLTINQANDVYGHEAEAEAYKIWRMSAPVLSYQKA